MISELRKKLGISLTDFAALLLTNISNISMWESGRRSLAYGPLTRSFSIQKMLNTLPSFIPSEDDVETGKMFSADLIKKMKKIVADKSWHCNRKKRDLMLMQENSLRLQQLLTLMNLMQSMAPAHKLEEAMITYLRGKWQLEYYSNYSPQLIQMKRIEVEVLEKEISEYKALLNSLENPL